MDEEEIKPRGLCGLSNIGNTCYMNSALQSLSNCPQLTQYLLKSDDFLTFPSSEKPLVSKVYKELIEKMWDKKRTRSLTPSNLLRAIRFHNSIFRGNYQQDTQEFLRCLMDRIHEELKRPIHETYNIFSEVSSDNESFPAGNKGLKGGGSASSDDSPNNSDEECSKAPLKRNRKRTLSSKSSQCSKKKVEKPKEKNKEPTYGSIITSLFDGKLLSSVQCLTCNRISNRVETFQDLSLPIPTLEDLKRIHTQAIISCSPNIYDDTNLINYMWSWMKSWFVGPNIKLEDCLAAFFIHDELKGDNMYSCEKCKKLRNGIRFSRVHNLPEILCIHLKRFRHELYYSSKISTYVSFPLYNLDMQNLLSKEVKKKSLSSSTYDLTSIICHFGSVGGGHYISYAKNCITNKWYEFNDAHVSEVDESVVLNAEAYVLFYSLKDLRVEESKKEMLAKINNSCKGGTGNVRFISKEWFTRYTSCIKAGPVSNYDFLCEHGAVDSAEVSTIRSRVISVPKSVSRSLIKKFGGGPDVSALETCLKCKELAQRQQFELEKFNESHEKFQEEQEKHSVIFQISVTWFNTWNDFANGRTKEIPGEIDNSDILPNRTNNTEGESYGHVSEETWNFFHQRYGGGPVLKKDKSPQEEGEESEGMEVDS